jgi:DNA primase
MLPIPELVLKKLGIRISKKNSQGYFVLHCPFHKNGKEKIPSLNLHSSNGYYKCHACGAKGKSVINFYINVTGKSFKEAAKDLNF